MRSNLNAICPYFTMFPLEFPLSVLRERAVPGSWVLDPFCGRGTTNLAARLVGLPTVGVDSSPVAAAISPAKLVGPSVAEVMSAAGEILEEIAEPADVPEGEFWELAYGQGVLRNLCRFREAFLRDCGSEARIALRAIILGALHGPLAKSYPSYFSNQAPRTYAPKPAYSVRYWRRHGLAPPDMDVLRVIRVRAERYYGERIPDVRGEVLQADSRAPDIVSRLKHVLAGPSQRISWVITSPPYLGMRTYIPDQWLRHWFVGGPPTVCYSTDGQLGCSRAEEFADELRRVWRNVGAVCRPGARMVVRFGAINYYKVDPYSLLKGSLAETGWRIMKVRSAGTGRKGKRQAEHHGITRADPIVEIDVYAIWEG